MRNGKRKGLITIVLLCPAGRRGSKGNVNANNIRRYMLASTFFKNQKKLQQSSLHFVCIV